MFSSHFKGGGDTLPVVDSSVDKIVVSCSCSRWPRSFWTWRPCTCCWSPVKTEQANEGGAKAKTHHAIYHKVDARILKMKSNNILNGTLSKKLFSAWTAQRSPLNHLWFPPIHPSIHPYTRNWLLLLVTFLGNYSGYFL